MPPKELTPVLPSVFGPKSPYRVKQDGSWKAEFPTKKNATPEDHERCRQDRRWLHLVPCKFGHLYPYGQDVIGYTGQGSPRLAALLEIPGVTLRQRGDVEFNVSFPESALAQVEVVVQPRRKRVYTAEQKAVMASRMEKIRLQTQTKQAFQGQDSRDVG